MTILKFPDNPSLGQKVTIDDREWTWDGERWLKIGGTGYQGSEGYFGSTGLQGSVGYSGSKGQDGNPGGPTGFTGSKGDTGDRGIDGYTGSSGAFAGKGFTGSAGQIGYDGSIGAVGYTGSRGERGFTGSRGLQGVVGFVGSLGYSGSIGYSGSTGIGLTGYTGSTGFVGSRGPQGVAGAPRLVEFLTGNGSNTDFNLQQTAILPMHIFVMVNGLVQMPYVDYTVNVNSISFINAPENESDIEIRYFDQAGFTGSTGDIGPQGPTGFRGSEGYFGSRGFTGYQGSVGLEGPPGAPGAPGGPEGYVGSKGDRGYTGSVGFRGSMGFAGAPKHSQHEVGDGANAIFELDYEIENATHILVMVNGLVQLPVIDYDLAGTNFIVFTNIPEDQSDIEIRFFQATGFDGSRGDTGYRGSTGYTGSKGPDGNPGGADGYTGSMGYTGSTGIGLPGPVGAPKISQVFQTDGVANTFTLRDIVYDPRHIFVMVNGLVQLPGVDYNLIGVDLVDDEVPPETPYDQDIEYVTTNGSTEIQFAVAPPINSDVEIRYFKIAGYAGSTGEVGYSGSVGDIGPTGFTGSVGYRGSAGVEGFRGSVGYAGSAGFTTVFVGPNPPPGANNGTVWWDSDNGILNFYYGAENVWVGVSEGQQGFTGSQGLQGPAGGYTGSEGFVGSVGYDGSIGDVGYTGSEGVGYTGSQGIPGEFAAVGYTGSIGTEGYSGSLGYTGSVGAGYTGSVGYVGSAGAPGSGSSANGYGIIGIASIGSANLISTKPNDSFTLIPGNGISFFSNGTALTINSTATGSGGVGLSPRLSNTVTTAVGSINTTIGLAKTFAILKIATSGSAWVRLYSDSASRTADQNRVAGDEPSADSGVIAEIITTGAETVRLTPAAIGWNDDNPTSNNIYLRITNNTQSPINTTIVYVPLES